MFYLDTSVLVATLTIEARTQAVQTWLADQASDDLAISEWVKTEFSSALAMKVRTGQIELRERTEALAAFQTLAAESFALLPVTSSHFRTAAQYADQFSLKLRAGDALHLAIAGARGATLCTLDQRLSDAGPSLGVATLMP